jgi:hypothetical protein
MLLHYSEYRDGVGVEGGGDNREYTSKRSYKKQPLLLQLSHLMFHQSTHTITFYPLPSYSQKIGGDNVFLSFFHHALPPFKVWPLSPDFRVEAKWLNTAPPQTSFTLLSSRYPFCHTIPAPFPLTPSTFNKDR